MNDKFTEDVETKQVRKKCWGLKNEFMNYRNDQHEDKFSEIKDKNINCSALLRNALRMIREYENFIQQLLHIPEKTDQRITEISRK